MLVLMGGEAPPNPAVSVLNPPGQDPHVRDPCFCPQHLGQGQYSQVPSQGPQGERVGARPCPSLWSCSRHGREHAELAKQAGPIPGGSPPASGPLTALQGPRPGPAGDFRASPSSSAFRQPAGLQRAGSASPPPFQGTSRSQPKESQGPAA